MEHSTTTCPTSLMKIEETSRTFVYFQIRNVTIKADQTSNIIAESGVRIFVIDGGGRWQWHGGWPAPDPAKCKPGRFS